MSWRLVGDIVLWLIFAICTLSFVFSFVVIFLGDIDPLWRRRLTEMKPLSRRRNRQQRCVACRGKPLLLIDGELCRSHAVGYDCTGYHGETEMCFAHEERWARLHAKERRVLGE